MSIFTSLKAGINSRLDEKRKKKQRATDRENRKKEKVKKDFSEHGGGEKMSDTDYSIFNFVKGFGKNKHKHKMPKMKMPKMKMPKMKMPKMKTIRV